MPKMKITCSHRSHHRVLLEFPEDWYDLCPECAKRDCYQNPISAKKLPLQLWRTDYFKQEFQECNDYNPKTHVKITGNKIVRYCDECWSIAINSHKRV